VFLLNQEKTMTQIISRARQSQAFGDSRQIHIPHSSWTRTERAPEKRAQLRPDEFWSRLGL
jgi:hypothetical protein